MPGAILLMSLVCGEQMRETFPGRSLCNWSGPCSHYRRYQAGKPWVRASLMLLEITSLAVSGLYRSMTI